MSENLESLRRHIRSVLEVYNPWWRDSRWYERDALIQEYQQGDIRVISRLYHHIASKITSPGKYGIATVRGPRRSGKTTMVKLIIYKLISEKGVNPINIYYIPLDYGSISNISLFSILRAIASEDSDEKYVFIDEASMYENWALDLKNSFDAGIVTGGRLKIIVTGSHSMDLSKAASLLKGRQGELAQEFNVGGNLLFTPLRFPEVVEGVRREIDELLASTRFRRPGHRFELLKELSMGVVGNELVRIYDEYFSMLNQLFENYLIHGGFPRAVKEFYTSGRVSSQLYADYAEILIKDSERACLDPEILKQILINIVDPRKHKISGRLDLESIKPSKVKDEELRRYLEYLTSTWSFFLSYPEKKDLSCTPNMDAQPKLYVLDPFIYYALYSYLNNVPDPFEEAKKLASNEMFKGLLVESIVASHILLAQQLFEHVPHVEYNKVLMYGLRESSEIDFVLCINKAGETNRFLIELKYRRQVPRISTAMQQRYLIVLTQKELEVDVSRRVVYIPTSIFLMLF